MRPAGHVCSRQDNFAEDKELTSVREFETNDTSDVMSKMLVKHTKISLRHSPKN